MSSYICYPKEVSFTSFSQVTFSLEFTSSEKVLLQKIYFHSQLWWFSLLLFRFKDLMEQVLVRSEWVVLFKLKTLIFLLLTFVLGLMKQFLVCLEQLALFELYFCLSNIETCQVLSPFSR